MSLKFVMLHYINKMHLQTFNFGKGQSKLSNKIYAYNSKKKRNIVK